MTKGLLPLVVLVTTTAVLPGCRHDASRPPPTAVAGKVLRGGWDPSYQDLVWNSPPPEPRGTLRVMLEARTNLDVYWGLLRAVIRHAPAARRLIILERMPEDGDMDTYWCGAVFDGAEGIVTYAARPLIYNGEDLSRRRRARDPASADARFFDDLWRRLRDAGVWRGEREPIIKQAVHPSAWFVHVFDTAEGHASFLFDPAEFGLPGEVEAGVVHGSSDLSAVPRTPAEAGFTEPEPEPPDPNLEQPGAGPEEEALGPEHYGFPTLRELNEIFEKTYGARLALHGALRLIAVPANTDPDR